MENFITEEEKNKFIALIDFYCAKLTSCSTVSNEFANGYNYAVDKLKTKIGEL
jgi:hypothetical protein